MAIKGLVVVLLCFSFLESNGLRLINDDNPFPNGLWLDLQLDGDEGGIQAKLYTGEYLKQSILLGRGLNFSQLPESCNLAANCILAPDDNGDSGIVLNISSVNQGFDISWETNNTESVLQDCIDLYVEAMHWYGGPERWHSEWPIETVRLENQAYRISKVESGAVAERYWLNSLGGYIFVEDAVPLFVDQNVLRNNSLCLSAKLEDPFIKSSNRPLLLSYVIAGDLDPSKAHLNAVHNYLGRPTGRPNERIIRHPIWTTWAKYKSDIDDKTVVDFAIDIAEHGFTGQVEIDDYWETCYGTATFNQDFADINSTVRALKDMGFTVSLWTHPFVNDDCTETVALAREKGYFIKSLNGDDFISWWDGNEAHHIDFSKAEAREWFISRLRLLQDNHGIDSFKFDAGETDWAPENPDLNADPALVPNILTSFYVTTCASFGDLIEVRSGWRTQNLPVFVRMLDKDSRWGLDNGLHSLITTLLQMNLNGYTMVLPDMIGGNGYGDDVVTAELLSRWTQANTFMPSMQFSYLPWEVTDANINGNEIVKKFVALHEQYTDDILRAMNASITSGIPVNPPIWWNDPHNQDALKCNDEFLLGENILVAPVIIQGAVSRDVVLPTGVWKDGNNGTTFQGPTILKDYPAPIDVLPYFIKQDDAKIVL